MLKECCDDELVFVKVAFVDKNFEILNLPENVLAKQVERKDLGIAMKSIWEKVFPNRVDLKIDEVLPDREKARKEILNNFNEKIFKIDIIFTEKLSGNPIGWIMGEQHDYETFYLRNSGFIPEFRRKKLYTISHSAIVKHLKGLGFERIVSDHLPNNKPMLLFKIKDGYIINNMTLDDRFGPMVRLVKFIYDDRQKFFEKRFRLPDFDL
ncbi:MAG: hypothetical protein A2622_04035 [Bdellovibrionales bacterium RIFCSPHIGHO2_01_FULL_40_29]|nr:MAG: hypothetical protein A2622_04035 [Bdellovibrionales bacterium RIFCSPHIGHO2_01_FULL_40_29]OFZ35319.1 MAG: hypothetical protein A3D17_07995 [Bdellovibrionales bacterium RIFCSPHIGHO2_02_FULL_40_15]